MCYSVILFLENSQEFSRILWALYKIKISSAWRQIPTCYQHLQEWLAKYDMEVYDKTPYVGGERGDDISAWYTRHPGCWQYAILDDDDDMGDHIVHLFRTDFDLGLTERSKSVH